MQDNSYHIEVETNAYTEIGFINWDGSKIEETYTVEWLLDTSPEWHSINITTPSFILPFAGFILPFAGKYKIRFKDKQYKCNFGSDIPEHAAAFTKIDLDPSYEIQNATHLFRDCVSLTSFPDLGNWNMSEATDMSNMFQNVGTFQNVGIRLWDSETTYSVGDLISQGGYTYVANRDNISFEPRSGINEWLFVSPSIQESNLCQEYIMPNGSLDLLSTEVKENIAGISSGDIPE